MKKFTKLFLSCAVVSAMAMSATAAFAELPTMVDITGQVTGTYTVADASVAITNFVQEGDTLDTTKPATYLVVKGDETVAAAQENIAGIDQVDTASATLTGAKTGLGNGNVTTVADGMTAQPYTVYVGYYNSTGTFRVSKGSFTLTDGSAPVVTGKAVKIGDMNWDETINGSDGTALLRTIAGLEKGRQHGADAPYKAAEAFDNGKVAAGGDVKIGDMNLDGTINGSDGTALLRTIAGLEKGKQYGGQEIKLNIPDAE